MRNRQCNIAVALLLVLLVACGASARTRGLQTSLVAVNVARDTLVAVSDQRQAQIVETATSIDQGKAALTAWRDKRAPVVDALTKAYQAIAAAALINGSITAVTAAVASAVKAVRELSQ